MKKIVVLFTFCLMFHSMHAFSEILRADLYSVDTYNALPHFSATSSNGLEKETEISQLVQMFVDHNIADDYGLVLLHKHFDLNPHEKLVESINIETKTSVAVPQIVTNTTSDALYPYRFEYIDDGYWIPLEYSLFDPINNPMIAHKYGKLSQNEQFLTSFGNRLKAMKLQNIFGITIKTRDHFAKTGTYETGSEDESYKNARILISRSKDGYVVPPKPGCVRVPAVWSLPTENIVYGGTQDCIKEECDDCPVQDYMKDECDDCPVQDYMKEECDDCPVQDYTKDECDDCPVQDKLTHHKV